MLSNKLYRWLCEHDNRYHKSDSYYLTKPVNGVRRYDDDYILVDKFGELVDG